ncbi:MAG: NADH-quinone oxidoreductase subunit NuoF [Spirochaetes bacterium]|nr:NADH-quinone oxidoreductase subunit NuoF [Spirochaetota bacterium]
MSKSQTINSLGDLIKIKEEILAKKNKVKGTDEIRICTGGSCIASGALAVKKAFEDAINSKKLNVRVKETGCMGPCAGGPVIMTWPDGIIYEKLTPSDADIIVKEHLMESRIVDSLVHRNILTGEPAPTQDQSDFFKNQQKIVLRNSGRIDPLDIFDYIAEDGYQALAKSITELGPDKVIEEMKKSGLRGRGGAGFPTWMKWNFTREAAGEVKYVLCNADEGDPGAFMDRSVLEGDPHSLIEGMTIAAFAVGAQRGFVYVRAEYPLAVARLEKAIEQAKEKGLLGEKIMGTDFAFDLEIRMGSGAFVCGEETALIHSIEGKRGEPRPRPPFPAQQGLWGKPSVLNNVETYANVAAIILKGAEWYASFGTQSSKGTKVFALAGSINNTGLVEVPIGTPLGELIYDIGGGVKNGKNFKAAQIGGPSGGCVPKPYLNVPLDYDSLKELGAIMGSGGLIVMDDDTCMVDVARYFLEFVQEESCGKCVPCRVGTKRMLEILERICSGMGEEEDIDRLIELGNEIRDTALCGLGQTAPNPVLSTIRHFRHEYEDHIKNKHCEAGVCPGLVRAPCQSACPASVDVPGFVSLVGEARYEEALRLHRERNPFAAICARVCFHTCEDKCRRASLDDPVAIRSIKRFMVDQEVVIQHPTVKENKENENRKIAIIGAGPSGLSCAYFLARLGYKPDVFEAGPRPGGMMVQTIPAYRLPRETLAREIRMIESLGAVIHTEQKLGEDFTLEELKAKGYEAVYVSVGAPEGLHMGIPGEDANGVVQALPFLQKYNIRGSVSVGKNVVVIGGGNAAIDAARTALRLGAESVSIIYRRGQDQMPAYDEEVEEALNEGVKLCALNQPVEFLKDDAGNVRAVKCLPMTLGDFDRSGRRAPTAGKAEPVEYTADQVIVAIGQRLDSKVIFGDADIEKNDHGFIKTDPVTGETSLPCIFAGGDMADGPSSVVEAIASGEKAAVGIDMMLSGENRAFWRYEQEIKTDYDPDSDPVPYPREKIRVLPNNRRRHNFDEVELPWNEAVARRQAHRCLRCDYGKSIRMRPKEEIHA